MTYVFTYENGSPPKWEKTFTAEGGETFSVALVFENEQDRLQLTAEQCYEHMNNMLQYVKDQTSELRLVNLEEEALNSYWPLHGNYDHIEKVMEDLHKWWNWAYYNDAFDTEPS